MDRGNPSARSGLVNFPTWDPRYKHTGEGGMFVRLVVLPNRDADFMVCAGGEIRFLADGVLVGDDLTAFPGKPERPDVVREGFGGFFAGIRNLFSKPDHTKAWEDYTEKLERRRTFLTDLYFQEPVRDGERGPSRRLSVDLLTAVTMGSTGWTGYDTEADLYWSCRYTDLTADGKALYDLIKLLYADTGQLALQTWLDR
ncbi:MAG: hypothetical protein GVY13_04565 [Alphaproteobacteria bacterium]|jgi:hypothetical protein|nr:hypothetical protein [Alphaproteobacteria bacterium]